MTPTPDDLPDTLSDASAGEHEDALAGAVRRLPEVGATRFAVKHMGAGYDRGEVDAYVAQVDEAVEAVRAAFDSGRQEVTNLRAENARLRAAAGGDLEHEITSGAVGLLSQAQLIADKAVADAEQYARDLVLTARNQYREILDRAESSATPATTAVVPAAHGPAVPEIEYVRTYAQVAQIQLRSVLEALTEQVDRLGTLQPPGAGSEAARPASSPAPADALTDDTPLGEPDWSPLYADAPAPQVHRSSLVPAPRRK
ncbi:DivIVA domain-containing protein [Agromyces larvae]|uniref:DivIVA domain-containing protein n=1 Tax=Agromyces larvae TaxID=2929802 RepID=A0ABY4BW93_9MICO|nr:DivIVA domain-containing protein [Agromyces larvae]UOE43490.1 DivIVA domain-containing protein [Agromyces larvae]